MAYTAFSQNDKISQGTIVEFMQDNAPQIAWVMEEQGGKVRLMLPNRRESNLVSARLLPWSGPRYDSNKSKDEIAHLLQTHKETRKELHDAINVLELWNMTQGEIQQECITFFAELMESDPNNDCLAAYAHALLNCKSHFKFHNPHFEVLTAEMVEQKVEAEKLAKERESLVGGGTNWFNHLWELSLKNAVYEVKHVTEPLEPTNSRLKHLLLSRIADPESQVDEGLWKQLAKTLPDVPHLPLLLAIAWGLVPEHHNFWLDQAAFDCREDFAIEYQAYYQKMATFVDELPIVDTQSHFTQLSPTPINSYIPKCELPPENILDSQNGFHNQHEHDNQNTCDSQNGVGAQRNTISTQQGIGTQGFKQGSTEQEKPEQGSPEQDSFGQENQEQEHEQDRQAQDSPENENCPKSEENSSLKVSQGDLSRDGQPQINQPQSGQSPLVPPQGGQLKSPKSHNQKKRDSFGGMGNSLFAQLQEKLGGTQSTSIASKESKQKQNGKKSVNHEDRGQGISNAVAECSNLKPSGQDDAPCTEHTLEQKTKLTCKASLPITQPDFSSGQDFSSVHTFFSRYFADNLISIDSPSTHDIDDAFSIKKDAEGNFHIHIALACPAAVWEFNSPFDKLIAQRTSSLYLPEGTYHMLPEILATKAFSLQEHKRRPALICYCKVSATGELLDNIWDFAQITVQDNLHYNACETYLTDTDCADTATQKHVTEDQEFLAHMGSFEDTLHTENTLSHSHEPSAHPIDDLCLPTPIALEKTAVHKDTLRIAYEFARTRLAWRIKQGAVIIEKEDMRVRLTNTKEEDIVGTKELACKDLSSRDVRVHIDYIAQTPKSQLIVSELMIIANAALAEFATEKNIPLIFRTQDIVLPKEFAGIWKKPQDIAKIARSLSSASTDTVAKPHAGLGLKAYSPVTSPLRRYADLVNEAQLMHYIYSEKLLWTKEELDKLILHFHIHNDAVNHVQRMRPRYWRFVYLQQEAKRQGERCGFHAIISDENDMHVTVTLTREQITVRSKRHIFGDKALLGQEVYVRLGKINPLRGEVSILAVQDI